MAQKPMPVVGLPVLIVDDDPTFLSFITAALSRHGRASQVAVTGDQALATLKGTDVQAVLLDFKLPDRDGVEVLREIVKDPDHPPVLLVSGAASISSAWEAGRLGAAGYLEKPFRISEMLAILDQLSGTGQDTGAPPLSKTDLDGTSSITTMSAASRLAQVVLRASLQSVDFKNTRGLAKAVNTGYGTMRHWCNIARVPGRAFIRFARGFWAIRRSLRNGRSPIEVLDCLEIESGWHILDPALPVGTTVEEYCASQTHLPALHPVVQACLNLLPASDSSSRAAGNPTDEAHEGPESPPS